jgi:tetratricopeptide (TPR) repeat protein
MEAHFSDELQLLSNALRTPSFRFIVVAHNRRSVYLDIKNWLIEKLGDSRNIKELSLTGKDSMAIRDTIQELQKGILLIPDFDFLLRDENAAQSVYFNQRRDSFARLDIAFICFIQPSNFQKVMEKLPDWWSLRSLELEFIRDTSGEPTEGQSITDNNLGRLSNLTVGEKQEELDILYNLIQQTDSNNKLLLRKLYTQVGELNLAQAKYDVALESFQKSLELSLLIGDRRGEAVILGDISHIHFAKSDYDLAILYAEQSLSIQQQIGDRQNEATTLNTLASIAYSRGEYEKALRYFEQSLVIRKEIGDEFGEGATLNNISLIYRAKGNSDDKALSYLEQSLSIRQKLGDRMGESATLNNISQVYYAKGDYNTTLHYLEQCLVITQQIGDKKGEGTVLNNLAGVASAKGDDNTALSFLEQSLSVQSQIGDIAGIAQTLNNMGAIFWKNKKDATRAISSFMQSYQIFLQIGSPDIKYPTDYLNDIIEVIGKASFEDILLELGYSGKKDPSV